MRLTAAALVLFQLMALLSGCLVINPDLTSAIGSALSQAISEQRRQESSQTETGSAAENSDKSGSEQSPEQSGAPSQSGIDPLFWELTSAKHSGKVYLFGSIHAARDDAYPLPEHILRAFESAEALAVECDTIAFEDDTDQQVAALRSIAYLDGTTIYDHLSEDNYYRAVELLRNHGLYAEQYNYYKPMLWTSILDSYIVDQAGLDYERGLDDYLMRRAKQSGKEIIEIESVEFQYAMIGGFSDRLQELILEGYLEDGALDRQVESLRLLYEAWARGDAKELSGESDDGDIPAEERKYYEEYNTKMLTERNIRMADAAESYLKRGMTVFLVVGSAHMLDDGGIVRLLRERGYTVTEHENRY